MRSLPLVRTNTFNKSLYVSEKKNCDGGLIVLEDRITEYYMDINDTTAVSIDTHLLMQQENSTMRFTLIVYSTGSNVLNLSGFNVQQIQVLDGKSTFSIMKGVGDAYWNIQMKSSDTRPEQWLKCDLIPTVPILNRGVYNFFNLGLQYGNVVNQDGIFSWNSPGTKVSTAWGSFNKNADGGYICAKFPMPVWIKSVCIMVATNTNWELNRFPINLQLYGTNDGVSWTQMLNTSLNPQYGSVDTYMCTTTNYYTMFKFKFNFDDANASNYLFPAIGLLGFSSELINTGTYSVATPYCTSLPMNGYNVETNASDMSSTSGNIVNLTKFDSGTYTMTRSNVNTPWEYIFTFPEPIRTIGFLFKLTEGYAWTYVGIKLFSLSYSDDKEIWTEYCKVDGALEAWSESFTINTICTYFCDSVSEHKYYKVSIYSKQFNISNELGMKGISFLQFQKGHYFTFESFIPKLSSNMQGGYILVASSSTQGDAYKLFDYSASSYGGGDISDGEWSLLIQLPQATVVKGLELVSPADGYNRMPYAFSIQGSQDNDTWTNIKTFLLGSNYWSSALQLGQWDIENETAYLYYRLVVTNTSQGSTVRIGEMGLSSYASFKGVNWYEEEYLVPVMSSNSQDGYIITSSSEYNSGHAAYYVFDRNISTVWASSSTTVAQWIQIQLPEAKYCNLVQITTRNDSYWNQIPTSFDVQGSNNGSDWTTLVSETNVNWTGQGQTKSFDISSINQTSYTYYRLYMTTSQVNYFGISEFTLINRTYHDTLEGENQGESNNEEEVNENEGE